MLEKLSLDNVLVFDIETVPVQGDFKELPEIFQELWERKSRRFIKEDEPLDENFFHNAGIYAEFGKIVCISAGFFKTENGQQHFRIRSFASKDEKELLIEFGNMLSQYYNDPQSHVLCGHNIREFDVPYVCRRMLVNGITLPNILDIFGKKPWEVLNLDTMDLWKFGDYKSYTSLKLLAALFGIPTPKDDIDGSDVGRVFWREDDLERIITYCQKDVLTVAQLLLKFKGQPLLRDEQVTIVD